MVDIAEVNEIAHLARLAMSEEEKKEAAKAMNNLLNYAQSLAKVDTSAVKPLCYMAANRDVLRDDEAGVEFTQEEALINAPSAKKGHFAVPKVIG